MFDPYIYILKKYKWFWNRFIIEAEELMPLNCGSGQDSWESFGQQGDPSSQSLKEINPEYSLEGLMLKLQYFGHLMRRAYSLEKTLMLGKIEGRRRRWWQRMRRLNSITDSRDINEFEQTLGDGEGQGSLECCSSWSRKESDTTEWLNNWNKEDNCNNKS